MDRSNSERPPSRRTGTDRPGRPSSARTGGGNAARASAAGERRVAERKPSGRDATAAPRHRWPKVVLLVLLAGVVAAAVGGCSMYSSIAGDLPDPANPQHGRDQTSKLLDRDGKVIASLFAEQNRTNVKLSQMPAALKQAVIATEDERYYQHKGVDPLGIMRALWTDVVRGEKAQGGSTITQQYVKKAFLTDERSLKRKVSEAILAYKVEKRFSKDEILEMYLNTIYFGHGAYGVERAAEVYFGKPVGRLDVAECAMLAGVIKSPARYSPRSHAKAARARRGTVLGQMRDQGYIDAATFAAADAEPFKLASPKAAATVAPYFVEYIKNTLIERFGADLVYRGGLSVRTSLDSKMQTAAERAVADTLDRDGDPSAALVAIDPGTGEVRAMVGGTGFATQQYNVAVQGRRQPGSAFKPFVLVAALSNGVSPEQTFESGPVELTPKGSAEPWKVTGAGGDRTGPMRLREATEKSVNSVFAQLILEIGADKVAAAAKDLGIVTPVEELPAIALGGLKTGVSPLEMASAYGTLANAGTNVPPHGIVEVKGADGATLMTGATKSRRAITPALAYLVTDMLKGVIERGTGESAGIGRPAAGKTGTTQAYRDAWFVGYTPQLATSVWVGYPDAATAMTSVHGRKVTGGSFPAQIWARFMKSALAGSPEKDFTRPDEGLAEKRVCAQTGLLATEYCPKTSDGLFLADALPKTCDVHTTPPQVKVPNVVGMTKDAARAAIEKAGLVAAFSEGETGTVRAQTPPAGGQVPGKTTVTLVLGAAAADASQQQKPVGQGPAASFTTERVTATKLTVTFDASASRGVAPLSFRWEFGDGSEGTGVSVSHAFAKKGRYVVTLHVTDASGAVTSVRRSLNLK